MGLRFNARIGMRGPVSKSVHLCIFAPLTGSSMAACLAPSPMPLPIDSIPAASPSEDRASSDMSEAITTKARELILRALADNEGMALNRAEVGEALRGIVVGALGVDLGPGFRDTVLAFARLLSKRIDRELLASDRVVDVALSSLVVSGTIGFSVYNFEARFWSLDPPKTNPRPAIDRATGEDSASR